MFAHVKIELLNRKPGVGLNVEVYTQGVIEADVPQGSKFGPLLILICINYLELYHSICFNNQVVHSAFNM